LLGQPAQQAGVKGNRLIVYSGFTYGGCRNPVRISRSVTERVNGYRGFAQLRRDKLSKQARSRHHLELCEKIGRKRREI
jgi:hypothetical protein